MVLNQQRRVAVDLNNARGFVRRLKSALKLGRRKFDVAFVDDARIAELNGRFRGEPRATDVLSFPWKVEAPVGDRRRRHRDGLPPAERRGRKNGDQRPRFDFRSPPRAAVGGPLRQKEFAGFLGDIVVSAETAKRNARAAGHSTAAEVRWLILHGALHLLGYDHETDRGEMAALEISLRERLGT